MLQARQHSLPVLQEKELMQAELTHCGQNCRRGSLMLCPLCAHFDLSSNQKMLSEGEHCKLREPQKRHSLGRYLECSADS